jgi:hypothetical protein
LQPLPLVSEGIHFGGQWFDGRVGADFQALSVRRGEQGEILVCG